jgi:hypothetical protein
MGVITSITHSSGMRSKAMATKQMTATPASTRFLRSGSAIFTAIWISSPAAAASPAKRCLTLGSCWKCW